MICDLSQHLSWQELRRHALYKRHVRALSQPNYADFASFPKGRCYKLFCKLLAARSIVAFMERLTVRFTSCFRSYSARNKAMKEHMSAQRCEHQIDKNNLYIPEAQFTFKVRNQQHVLHKMSSIMEHTGSFRQRCQKSKFGMSNNSPCIYLGPDPSISRTKYLGAGCQWSTNFVTLCWRWGKRKNLRSDNEIIAAAPLLASSRLSSVQQGQKKVAGDHDKSLNKSSKQGNAKRCQDTCLAATRKNFFYSSEGVPHQPPHCLIITQ